MWKAFVQRQLRKLGYEIRKRGDPSLYTERAPYAYTTYSPWFDDPFTVCYRSIRDHTAVTEDRCYILGQLGRQCTYLPGDFAEAGVYKGGTACLLAQVMAERSAAKRLHLFDTFAGMPAIANADPSS